MDTVMSIAEQRKYLCKMQQRYREANRSERGELLNEMERVTEKHRKSLIRLMNGSLARSPRQQQRGRIYGAEVDDAIRLVSESLDYICAERLTPSLAPTAQHLVRHAEMYLSPTLLDQLKRISVSTGNWSSK